MPRLGKIHPKIMQQVYRNLGFNREEVLIGPKFGVDNAVVRVSNDTVLIAKTDPISIIPKLGLRDSAWLSVQLLASDVTTSGFPPAYAILDFNLPPSTTDREFLIYWNSMQEEFRKLGVMTIGGHTGRFEGCGYTVVGGCTLLAIGREQKYLSSNMARVGDSLIVTKSAALAATGILSRVFPRRTEKEFGSKFLKKAQKLFYDITTVNDALLLVKIGVREDGVSAMHDATEGGVLGGIFEMLTASNKGGVIYVEALPLLDEAREVCKLFSIDPYISLGEGALIASVRKDKVEEALKTLREAGIKAAEVGMVEDSSRGIILKKGSRETPLKYPVNDPYWKAYWKAIQKGWT